MNATRPYISTRAVGPHVWMGVFISMRLRMNNHQQQLQAWRKKKGIAAGSGMGTSPVIPATMLFVALLVAVCFGATAARSSHARHTDADDAIRLPSSFGAGGRPWNCCDSAIKDASLPAWRCNDVVDKCSADCQDCEASPAGDGFVCGDFILSLTEPPVCTPRPWDCCDSVACTRDYIPNCMCLDKVESCSSNCERCEFLYHSDPPRFQCRDIFHGYPGPKYRTWISTSN
jgi:hypothetical protein